MADAALFEFDNTFVRELPELGQPWTAAQAPAPHLLALNDDLAAELGVDAERLRDPSGVAVLVGNVTPDGAAPFAQAYAGHQFGGYSPRLGDGRALLLGEVHDVHGRRRDLHLKGSGRTPFARGGDGKAVVGPMLRELVIGEAMHALGIPTTRALAVVGTGEQVARERLLPGAVLVRVAASHIRVGTFQYANALRDDELLRRLADYAIARHHPGAVEADNPYVALFTAVIDAQASLIARWMHVGFIHGVMNTDNMTISGESIDFGPCAFIDAYDPATVFSSIDHGGRYAYGAQPSIGHWNLARFGETLIPLFSSDVDAAVDIANETLSSYPERFRAHWMSGMRDKLGIVGDRPDDASLVEDLLAILREHKVDYTSAFRALSSSLRGEDSRLQAIVDEPAALAAWIDRWRARVAVGSRDTNAVARAMDQVNPLYIPRNHVVEASLSAATEGDLSPFEELLAVVRSPFDERPGLEEHTRPAPPEFGRYQTFCGT